MGSRTGEVAVITPQEWDMPWGDFAGKAQSDGGMSLVK